MTAPIEEHENPSNEISSAAQTVNEPKNTLKDLGLKKVNKDTELKGQSYLLVSTRINGHIAKSLPDL